MNDSKAAREDRPCLMLSLCKSSLEATPISRGNLKATPRDNVVFELGLFIGRIGRQRSLLVEPRGEEIKLPSDLSGITALTYRYDADDLDAVLGPACNRIRKIIQELGPNN